MLGTRQKTQKQGTVHVVWPPLNCTAPSYPDISTPTRLDMFQPKAARSNSTKVLERLPALPSSLNISANVMEDQGNRDRPRLKGAKISSTDIFQLRREERIKRGKRARYLPPSVLTFAEALGATIPERFQQTKPSPASSVDRARCCR
jgi:hypothetical protein